MATIKTLSELISTQSRYDLTKITYLTKTDDGDIVIPDTNVFTIYMRFIQDYITIYKVNDTQRRKYRCKPGLLSMELYGTPDLAWLILKLNDQESPSKFRLKSNIKLISITDLNAIYTNIVSNASDKLSRNWAENLLE